MAVAVAVRGPCTHLHLLVVVLATLLAYRGLQPVGAELTLPPPTAIDSTSYSGDPCDRCVTGGCLENGECSCPIGVSGDRCEISNGVCVGDIDVRNNPRNLKYLRGCRVIEGSLLFVLIDEADSKEYDGWTFPELQEITGFFVAYRVANLTSFSKLFPNLSVIRGNKLMFNYALVIYEMYQLEDIGLSSLTQISRGAVRFEKNPNLCYLDAVSWGSMLSPEDMENNIFTENKPQKECLIYCPGYRQRQCQQMLPHGSVRELCWNSDHCQRICHSSCPHSCRLDNTQSCCHRQCLGGCHGSQPSECVACKNYQYEGTCLESCPPGTVLRLHRYCIPPKDCPLDHKLIKNECVMGCPTGYTDDPNDNRSCIECTETCPKVCDERSIESLTDLETMEGCTIITGTLTITLQGGQSIVKKLESYLGLIEEITGSLAIIRSYSLVSLSFLRSLRVIHGNKLQKDEFSVFIHDNRNLQDMFPSRQDNFVIKRGRIYVHSNPKICHNKIENFTRMAGLPPNDTFLSAATNGNMITCSVVPIELTFKLSSLIIVKWTITDAIKSEVGDFRKILGCVVSYRATPFQNVTEFDGEETCGQSLWKSVYAEPDDNFVWIPDTKAATQYAIYFQSYAVSTADRGIKSKIYYVTTKEQKPDPPTNIMIHAVSSSNLKVTWGPPENPNGNITRYIVTWTKQAQNTYGDLDLCVGKLPSSNNPDRPLATEAAPPEDDAPPDECDCTNCEEGVNLDNDQEASNKITFENALHNFVFVKSNYVGDLIRPDRKKRRRRREISPTSSPLSNLPDMDYVGSSNVTGTAGPQYGNDTATVSPSPTAQPRPPNKAEVFMEMSYVITGLGHFEQYIVMVVACNSDSCSDQEVAFGRTLPKDGADDIVSDIDTEVVSQEESEHNVLVKWEPPPASNGAVLKYDIEVTKITDTVVMTTATPTEENKTAVKQEGKVWEFCLSANKFAGAEGYRIELSDSGTYTLRLRAVTLAGYGSWSKVHTLEIPHLPEEPSIPNQSVIQRQAPWLIGAIAFILLLIMVFVFIRYRYRKDQTPDAVLYASANPEYLSTNEVYVADEWEFPREKLTIVQELGKGGFGMVYQGIAVNILPEEDKTTVAVKSVQANASMRDRIEFLNEASVMKTIKTHHVVRLLGVVSKGQPAYVVMEYMAQGDLKNWLRARRAENQQDLPLMERKHPPTYAEVIKMSAEIADGMAYLGGNKYVHRDLSARNCLVSDDGTCKVADFGLARDIYQSDYYRKERGGMLPIRWMAPESVRDGVFTTCTDVWSYGILLWEIASLGEMPYGGLNNEGAGEYVKQGRILNMPEGCPEKLQELMLACWAFQDKLRPTFFEIVHSLESTGFLPPVFRAMSFYHRQERLRDQRGSACSADLEQATMLPSNGMNDYTYMDKGSGSPHPPRNGIIPANGRIPGSGHAPHGSPTHTNSSLEHTGSSPEEEHGSPSIGKCTEC